MRTFEDVKTALKKYQDALTKESYSNQVRYIVTGGNMCIIKKGVGQYILSKGDPVPMRKDTARNKIAQFKDKCGANIKLELIKYNDCLNANIKECQHLIQCMNNSLSGTGEEFTQVSEDNIMSMPQVCSTNMPINTSIENPEQNDPKERQYQIELSCPNCPYNINMCMACKFAKGVNMDVFPWQIICTAELNIQK